MKTAKITNKSGKSHKPHYLTKLPDGMTDLMARQIGEHRVSGILRALDPVSVWNIGVIASYLRTGGKIQ